MTPAFAPAQLERRFIALWQRSFPQADAASASSAWAVVRRRYEEPHRYYHGLAHIAFCLEQMDLIIDRVREPDIVELAAWFHDVVYEPGSPENEADSAAMFRRLATDIDSARADRVADLILDTMHRQQPDDGDARYLVDVDLASLGQPWPRFRRDGDALRREQPQVADADYFRAQRAFLGQLLARRHLYSTPFFRARYETVARQNIERCLQQLPD